MTTWRVSIKSKEILKKRSIYTCYAELLISGVRIIGLKVMIKEDYKKDFKIINSNEWKIMYEDYLLLLMTELRYLLKTKGEEFLSETKQD